MQKNIFFTFVLQRKNVLYFFNAHLALKITKVYSKTDFSVFLYGKLVQKGKDWQSYKYQKTSFLKLLLLLIWLIYCNRSWMLQLSYWSTQFRNTLKKANMDPNCLPLKHQDKFASSFAASIVLSAINVCLHLKRKNDYKMLLKTGFYEVVFYFAISCFILTNLAFFYFKGHC